MNSLYQLATDCRLLDFEQLKLRKSIDADYEQQLASGQSFVLERKGNLYLINPTIKIFLECFEHSTDLTKVTKSLAEWANCPEASIQNAVQDFFDQMRKLKVIVSGDQFDQKEKEKAFASIEAGTLLGDLRFEERIFINSKIEIYKAYSFDKKCMVAVKILRRIVKDQNSLRSFAQEFFLLDELSKHPHICQFIELVQNESRTYGVIEFIDGLPGRKYIKNKQPDLTTKLFLLGQFYDAMAFIHRKGFLHGDLHLSNLLIDKNNHLKIIDFNMSNRIKPVANELIREGGVHQYIAPEKVDSRAFKIVKGPATYTSEVFQMGVISYYFLYERMPFAGFIWKELAASIRNDQPLMATKASCGATVPIVVRRAIQKMLDKDPERRFPNANILIEKWRKQIRASQGFILRAVQTIKS